MSLTGQLEEVELAELLHFSGMEWGSPSTVTTPRVPFFSRIPLLGWLFRNKQIDRTNDELIIFLTPSIQKT